MLVMLGARLAARWQPAGRWLLLVLIDHQGESICWFSPVSSSYEVASRLALGAIVVAARKQDRLTAGLRGQFRRLAGLSGAVDGIW